MKAEIDTGQISFFSNGENLIDYTIYGAAGGVGERTANLVPPGWAEDFASRINDPAKAKIENDVLTVDASAGFQDYDNKYIFKTDWQEKTAYTLTYRGRRKAEYSTGATTAFYYTDGSNTRAPWEFINDNEWHIYSGTSNAKKTVKYIAGWYTSGSVDIDITSFSVNKGNTSIVEPYGYKIPILCGGETTNIYLDEPLYEGDSITFSTAQVDIPTNNGQNTLTVDTQVKPSKIIVKTNKGIFQNTPENPPENKSSSDHPYDRKMDTRNEILRAWATKDSGRIVPKSWNHVQFLVKHGLHKNIFNIKDQFIMQKDNTNLVWDIIGKDHDTPSDSQYTRSMTLQLHDQFSIPMQFDAPEAFYYCEGGLAAGTYYFTIASTYEPTNNDLSAYQFTLTQSVPAGGQLTFPWGRGGKASSVKVNSFASRTSTTAIEQVSVTEGTDGQNLGNLTVAGDFSNDLNSIDRVRYGSNNYKESAIRQWLNSSAAAGSVWKPQTKWDRPPAWAATTAGFMNGMDADFLTTVGKTHIITARNTVCEGGGYDEMDDYFFLLSRREVYMGNEVSGVIEGEPYPYYSDYSDLSAPGTGADSNRIKYRGGTAQYWWLRTPYSEIGYIARHVSSTGYQSFTGVSYSDGIAPACNII